MMKNCNIPGCGKPTRSRGLCATHLWRASHGKDLNAPVRRHDASARCKIDGCDYPVRARGWCNNHYHLWRRNGSPHLVRAMQSGLCTIEGCARPKHAHGICKAHYKTPSPSRITTNHGLSRSREYRCWRNMIARCHHTSSFSFANYGGRGIKVCESWRTSFVAFYEHIGPSPSPHHTVDRIKADRDYEPGNVRWATSEEQAQNRRTNVLTPELVIAVRSLKASGGSVLAWAEANNVGYSAARNAANGNSWRNF